MLLKRILLSGYRLCNKTFSQLLDRIRFGKNIDFIDAKLGIYGEKEAHYVGYEQSNILFDRSFKRYLTQEDHSTDCILDIGCGKGRMLYYFWKCGFGKADGVEYSEELSEIALSNYDIIKSKKRIGDEVFDIFNYDAVNYPNYDKYNYFYLYNPFDEVIMRQVINRIIEAHRNDNEKIVVFYKNPLCGEVLEDTGVFKLKHKLMNSFIWRKLRQEIYVYENR